MQAKHYFFQSFLNKQASICQENVTASMPTISQSLMANFLMLWFVGSNALAVDCASPIGSPYKPSAFQPYQPQKVTSLDECYQDNSLASVADHHNAAGEVAPEKPEDLARPFQCEYDNCLKRFKTKYALNDHRRVHTGERPFWCPYEGCDRRFADGSNLIKHKKIHQGIKRYYCSQPKCSKGFLQKSDLTRHAAVHSPMKNFSCNLCGNSLKRKDNLERHYRQVHGAEFQRDES
jgi:hypothetical protein